MTKYQSSLGIKISCEKENILLRFYRLSASESAKAFLIMFERYIFMHRNSAAFHKKCNDQQKAGINPFEVWMEKQGFEPIFRVNRTA